MSIYDLIREYDGKQLDFDGAYGGQCTDLAKKFASENGKPVIRGNGKDWANAFNWVAYKAGLVPSEGDIIVWGTGVGIYGHVAVVIDADAKGFKSFDQNWDHDHTCHIETHSYKNILGWNRLEEEVTREQIARIKIDTLEELLLNRPLNDGDVPAIEGRKSLLLDSLNAGKPINVALSERVDDIVRGALGDDKNRLRDVFNRLLNNVPQ